MRKLCASPKQLRLTVWRGIVSSEPVWGPRKFALELEKAKRIGPHKISDAALVRFCRGAQIYFVHFWVDAGPFFIELWKRIEEGRMRGIHTKTQAAQLIGVSMRWIQKIIAGTARSMGVEVEA